MDGLELLLYQVNSRYSFITTSRCLSIIILLTLLAQRCPQATDLTSYNTGVHVRCCVEYRICAIGCNNNCSPVKFLGELQQ